MLEHGSWMLPVAKEAYKNRKEIIGAWERFTNWLLGQKRIIVFTGCAGVGKTVLLDHLTGDAYKRDYHPPDESQESESGKITEQRKRIHLVTVPGQNSGPRYEALNKLITDKKTIDGVIHVVANGFASIRSETAKEILQRDKKIQTIEAYREAQLKIELEDLQHTCEFIRRSHQRHHRPSWLLIAVAKIDLYYDVLDTARMEYSPLGNSDFSKILNRLRNEVGNDFFRWDAAPVWTWLENFEWNKQTTKCELLPEQRDHYVATFARKLETFC